MLDCKTCQNTAAQSFGYAADTWPVALLSSIGGSTVEDDGDGVDNNDGDGGTGEDGDGTDSNDGDGGVG